MTHANSPLSERGRLRLARCVVERGWSYARVAERFQVAATTARRWANRYRELGPAGMVDRSSRPATSPARTPARIELRVIGLRVTHSRGPARIGYHLDVHSSTVHKILTRYGLPATELDRPHYRNPATRPRTRDPLRALRTGRPGPRRHQEARPDPRRRRPPGSGPRTRQTRPTPRNGLLVIHTAVDVHSRLGYSELLTNERKRDRCRVLAARQRLIQLGRDHRVPRPDRQRRLLPLPRLR